MIKKIRLILLILLFSFTVYAEIKIDKVEVRGNHRIPLSTIIENGVKPGDDFDLKKIDESVKNLYKTGLFLDVKVDLTIKDEKVVLTYIVKEKPYINKIYFEGNDEIKEDTLKEVLVIHEGDPFNKRRIEQSIAEIRRKYEDENFYNVKVSYDIEERKDNSVDLIFTIDEGKEAKVVKINFYGNKAFKDKELKKIIETDEKGFFSWLTGSGKLKREELELDRERIRAKYLNSGYMRVKVAEPEVKLSDDKTKITITFRIEEGKPYKVRKITFEGNVHRKDDELKKRLTLKEGELFSSEKFRHDIDSLTDAFTEIGYAFANVDPNTILNDEKQTVDIVYKIEENVLVHINEIIINGNTKTRDRVIRREFDIHEGEIYNSKKIRASKRHVENTGYFEEVSLVEDPVAQDKVDLKLDVREKPTGMFTLGAGYSTLDGFVGTIQVSQQNLFGLGYKLSLKSEFSAKRTDYTLSFTNPWLFDRPITFGFDLYNLKRSYFEYTKKSMGGALRLGHSIIERKLYAYYRLAYDKIDIYDIDDTASDYIKEQEGKTVTISFTPSLVWNTLDNPFDPTKGNKSRVFVKYAGGILGGDNNFVKTGVESAQYFPLFWKFVGMLHGEIGYVKSLNGDPIPIDERYRLGGMYSVRGFKYGDISPKDETGYDYGGDKYVLFNAEVTFPLSEAAKLKGVIFFDAGQVYDNGEDYFSYDLRKSVGFGFRWFSPIGPLRLEYGRKLDRKEGESLDRWDFSIGGMF
ncbi:outer membrane protein assembly factor BamA [Deferribacter autotrophicus]|uniref:Outer membrane protein assembly factor BamA n=1 Tax=Deferribacter autotrophicus TaxID=500465 RepID=A0A5A8F4Z8_9BACT|nr:outer membrane protein assembly factor BamA [Deferribacter autotrophicus]KAA0257732.1 outer membrane protein assembly factor BamA [Deferribacter autotrophicus]